jgi:hypothetical protein
VICEKCGSKNDENVKFCNQCAHPLATQPDRTKVDAYYRTDWNPKPILFSYLGLIPVIGIACSIYSFKLLFEYRKTYEPDFFMKYIYQNIACLFLQVVIILILVAVLIAMTAS